MKKIYKSTVIKEKRQFKQKLYNQLEGMSEDNPKEYWEIFDKSKDCHDKRNNMDCPINDTERINSEAQKSITKTD